MMSMWLLFVFTAAFVWSFANIVVGALMKKTSERNSLKPEVAHFMIVLGLGGIIPFTLSPFIGLHTPPNLNVLFLTLGSGVLYLTGLWFIFLAYKFGEATRIVPLLQMGAVFILLLSWVFLGETLRLSHAVAFFLLLFGAVMISIQKIGKKIVLSKSLWCVLAAEIILGLYYTLLKYLLEFLNYKDVFILSRAGVFFTMVLILISSGTFKRAMTSFQYLNKKTLLLMFNNEILNLVGGVAFTVAYTKFYLATGR